MFLTFIKNNNTASVSSSGGPMTTLHLLLEEWLIFNNFQEFMHAIQNPQIEKMSYNNVYIEKFTEDHLKMYHQSQKDETTLHLIISKAELIKITRVFFEFLLIPWQELSIVFDGTHYTITIDGEIQVPKNTVYLSLI